LKSLLHLWKKTAALGLALSWANCCSCQSIIADKGTANSLETVAAFCQSLAQWTFIIIGGSLVVLVGTSYYRPARVWVRLIYLLFIPSWVYLAQSIYFGLRTQEAYAAYLLVEKTTLQGSAAAMNGDAQKQISSMEIGLLLLTLWLVLYLFWWIFENRINFARGVS
jgi:hypothetical protein